MDITGSCWGGPAIWAQVSERAAAQGSSQLEGRKGFIRIVEVRGLKK